MPERQTDIEELRRWCRDAGHYSAIEIIDRFCALSEIARAALRLLRIKEQSDE